MALDEQLTAAEKRALRKRIRNELIDAVYSELEKDVKQTARKIVKAELKSLSNDDEVMSELRKLLRLEMEKTVKSMAASLCVDRNYQIY